MMVSNELWNYKIQRDREDKPMKEQVKKLKRHTQPPQQRRRQILSANNS